jgi:hypothetical protein
VPDLCRYRFPRWNCGRIGDKGFVVGAFRRCFALARRDCARSDSDNSLFAKALARDIRAPQVEIRKLFDIVRDDVLNATKRAQQPFTYGSPPGREDFYFVAGK